jgi:hypothetical protein
MTGNIGDKFPSIEINEPLSAHSGADGGFLFWDAD